MALMNCPECDHEISTAATACPNCGHPVKTTARIERPLPRFGILELVLPAIMVLLALAAIVWFALGHFGVIQQRPGSKVSCDEDAVKAYLDVLTSNIDRWNDSFELASSVSQLALVPRIETLQRIRLDTRSIYRPDCSDYLNDRVIYAMDEQLMGMMARLKQTDEEAVAYCFEAAEATWGAVEIELKAFKMDPVAAYLRANSGLEAFHAQRRYGRRFELPAGWQDYVWTGTNLKISFPESWTVGESAASDEHVSLIVRPPQGEAMLHLALEQGDSSADFTKLQSDLERLDFLREKHARRADDWDDAIVEQGAHIRNYAANKGYMIYSTIRPILCSSKQKHWQEQLEAVVIPPGGQVIGALMTSGGTMESTQLSGSDIDTFKTIVASVRYQQE